MTAGRISDAQLIEIKLRHPCDQVAAQWVKLRQHGRNMIGPCPICSDDKQSRKAGRFKCTPDGWVCAVCPDGGDVIKLVRKVQNLEFPAAVEWLGGTREVDPVAAERLEREAKQKRDKRERENNEYRERERATVFKNWWKRGVDPAGTEVEQYLARRHLVKPAAAKIRALAEAPLYNHGGKDCAVAFRGTAMLAPIVDRDGKFRGLHATYLDLAQQNGKAHAKDPETGADLPAKKVRGSVAGNHIELMPCARPRILVIGEGIETVLSTWRAFVEAGRDLAGISFWSSVDLGNLGGRAAATVRHPSLKTATNRAQRVPGPIPDLAAPGIEIPISVEKVIILGDGDSDRFLTQCAIVRAAARFSAPGRQIVAAWAPDGQDFNDLAPDWPAILAIVDGALAPVISDLAADVAAPAAPPPAADPPAEKATSSQDDAAPKKPDGRKGAGRRASERRERIREKLSADDVAELDLRLAFFPQTDLGNAERFRERYRGKLLWCQAIGWLAWDGKRWARNGADDQVKRAEHATVRSIQDEADALIASGKDVFLASKGKGDDEVEIMLSDSLRSWGRASESNSKLMPISKQACAYLSVQPDQLDADPFRINVDNGTLVVRRWTDQETYVKFFPHNPADLNTKISPVKFDRDAACPGFDKFMFEVQPHEETRRFLFQFKGLSLTGDVTEQRLCMHWGKGKNGKSVFEDVTAHIAGDYAETVPIETFMAEGRGRNAGQATPDLAILPGVRMLRTSEPKRNAALDEGLIKLATGGEPIIARHLNRDYFKFYPQFKLSISGNYRPKITGNDEGIWRRVILVPWLYTVPDEKRDLKLGEKLKAKEASGILNRMIDGLCDWLDRGLVVPADVTAATKDYRRDSDPLGRFLAACVVEAEHKRVQASVLHDLFCAWAKANSATEWSARGLNFAMQERGFRTDKSSVMYWVDIATTATVGDFVDSQGHARRQDGEAEDAPPAGAEAPFAPRDALE